MMAVTLSQLIRNLERMSVDSILSESVKNTDSDLLRLHSDQWKHGRSGDGDKIGKYKNKAYRRKKFEMNPLAGYGNVDLELFGELKRQRRVEIFSDSYFIISLDDKAEKLTEKYGEDIWRLSPVYQKTYVKTSLRAAAFLEFKRQLFL
jgi:hypothetical protein